MKTNRMQIHIGTSGWFYWHWRGVLYPKSGRPDRWFKLYTHTFRTVELNAPFYKWPAESTVKGWRRNAPEGFRYSVKVNRLITHDKRLQGTKRLIGKFYSIAETLGTKMGCFLFQFPPGFRYSAVRLRNLVDQLDPAHRNAIEFRHPSWWRDEVYCDFAKAGLIFCSVSGPKVPDDLIKTSDALYVRFHGHSPGYGDDYQKAELAAWAGKICLSGAREAWIYFNNDRKGYAVENARQMIKLIQRIAPDATCS